MPTSRTPPKTDYLGNSGQIPQVDRCGKPGPVAVSETVPVKSHGIVKAAGIYFTLVFGAGFVLGTIRVLWLVPAVGTRTAELVEMPVMLAIVVLSARWVTQHIQVPPTASSLLGMGGMALAMILALDFTVVLWIRGLSFRQYVEAFDPVAGTAYFVTLGLFALMPWFVAYAARPKGYSEQPS